MILDNHWLALLCSESSLADKDAVFEFLVAFITGLEFVSGCLYREYLYLTSNVKWVTRRNQALINNSIQPRYQKPILTRVAKWSSAICGSATENSLLGRPHGDNTRVVHIEKLRIVSLAIIAVDLEVWWR